MAMQPPTQEEIARRQEEDGKLIPTSGDPVYVNQEALALLSTVMDFEYPKGSGIWYSVPHVPYYEGTQIRDIHSRIMEARKFPDQVQVGIFDKMLDEVLDIAWKKLVIPQDWLTRFLKWTGLMKNPFKRHMGEGEVASLIGFFLARRMTSNVHFRYPAQAASKEASTS